MPNSFFGNNLSKIEKLRLKEMEAERNERICDELEDQNFKYGESSADIAERLGATQNDEGDWSV